MLEIIQIIGIPIWLLVVIFAVSDCEGIKFHSWFQMILFAVLMASGVIFMSIMFPCMIWGR